MGSDERIENPVEQVKPRPVEEMDETTSPRRSAAGDDHSEQWRANASKAGEKIKAMFKS
jgi:hypothetical protein